MYLHRLQPSSILYISRQSIDLESEKGLESHRCHTLLFKSLGHQHWVYHTAPLALGSRTLAHYILIGKGDTRQTLSETRPRYAM